MTATPVYSSQISGTSVGTIRIWATAAGIRRIAFRAGMDLAAPGERVGTEDPPGHLGTTVEQLRAYLDGDLRDFDVPLDLGAFTDFQLRVFEQMRTIPFGTVVTYGELAKALGMDSGSARAVGGAVGANPVAVVVPCHRVVGSDLTLHGFSGGLPRKAWLLRHEGIVVDGETARSRVHPEELRLPL